MFTNDFSKEWDKNDIMTTKIIKAKIIHKITAKN